MRNVHGSELGDFYKGFLIFQRNMEVFEDFCTNYTITNNISFVVTSGECYHFLNDDVV